MGSREKEATETVHHSTAARLDLRKSSSVPSVKPGQVRLLSSVAAARSWLRNSLRSSKRLRWFRSGRDPRITTKRAALAGPRRQVILTKTAEHEALLHETRILPIRSG